MGDLRNEINERSVDLTVPEVPTCHKCGAFMVKAKPVYDCPECGATTAITECTASPLVMAAQAQPHGFIRIMDGKILCLCNKWLPGISAFASHFAVAYASARLLELRHLEHAEAPDKNCKKCRIAKSLEASTRQQLLDCVFTWHDAWYRLQAEAAARLREAEQQRDALRQQCDAWAQKSGGQQADAADLRGLLREAGEALSLMPGATFLTEVVNLCQRIQQALAK